MDTLFVGKIMLFLTEVESTNTYAMHMLRNVKVMEGTVVYTNNQTHGKGQRNALWESTAANNMLCSVILKPVFLKAEFSFFLSKITALAVYDLLTEIIGNSQYDIKIKWPNDILVNRKKIAGILIENNYINTDITYSVIGVGININQTDFVNSNAASLKQLTGINYNVTDLINKFCDFLEKWYLILKAQKFVLINERYHSCLFGFKVPEKYQDMNDKIFTATIEKVDINGHLQLKSDDDRINNFEIKQVKLLY